MIPTSSARSLDLIVPSTVVKFAASSSLYDDAPIHATRGHPTAWRLERRKRRSARKANSACAARTASAGALLYEPRRRGAHFANHRARQRDVSSVCRQDTSALAKPATLFRCRRATDATHHG